MAVRREVDIMPSYEFEIDALLRTEEQKMPIEETESKNNYIVSVLTVGDIIALAEYINCEVVDFNGETMKITDDNYKTMYAKAVEHIDAENNVIKIWTYDNMLN